MDCLEGMKQIPDGSVDLVVTSPPYDNLRTYNNNVDKTWDEHVWKPIIKELYRVVKHGGVVVWVVGDATIKGSETGTSFRQALYFMECGFNLHDTMIYRKVNPIPQNHNRYEQCFEYMFCFTKGRPNTFNPIMVKTVHGGDSMNWGGRKTLMDDSQCRRHRDNEIRTVKDTKRHCNIFEYTIGGEITGHPAVFPKQLAIDQIVSWTNEGDIVLDPFMGSGTTAIACIKSVGISSALNSQRNTSIRLASALTMSNDN
jgi:site-specific DNA-methyltransferase (adenine-specific)